MVMALTSTSNLGKVRPVCLSRLYLQRAYDTFEKGEHIASGCYLREAVYRYLFALCEYHDCLPKKKRNRIPRQLLKALTRLDLFSDSDAQWLEEAILYCNKLAHCRPVRASLVETAIEFVHSLLDYSAPELIFPTREGGAL